MRRILDNVRTLARCNVGPLSPSEMTQIGETLVGAERFEGQFKDRNEFDVSYDVPSVGRYRVNIFRQRGLYAAILRVVPLHIKTFEELNLPRVMEKIANLSRGLVLASGATGNG